MKAMLGEEGTEQFTVTTKLNGRVIGEQKIHDPFIHSTLVIGWLDMVRCLLTAKCRVEVSVRGTQSVQARIMTLDPEDLQREEAEREEYARARRSQASGQDAQNGYAAVGWGVQ